MLSYCLIPNAYSKCRADNIPKATIRPQIQGPEDEIKTTDLVWVDFSHIPNDAIKVLKNIYRYPENGEYSLLDINYDGINEIILKNNDYSGSGGRGFSILEKQNGKWHEILGVTGGFIFGSLNVPDKYDSRHFTITQWTRVGGTNTIQSLWAYKKNKYELVSDQPVPITVLYSKDFQKLLLDINWMCWDFWN
jgi:hypothetical protein